jgi:hypothetical protein
VRRGTGWVAGFALLAAAITGCQERLTAPAECPELCPGGQSQVFDTVLNPIAGKDSSYAGYVARGLGASLRVSNGLPASEDRTVVRFARREDSIAVRDTLRAYTVDSVELALNVVARDTLVNGLKVFVYRIDPGVDSTATFESIDSQLVPTAIIDSISVPDTVASGAIRTVLKGPGLEKVALPPGTGGVLAIGLSVAADQPTGARLGALGGGTGATFTSFLTVDVPDTATSVRKQTRVRAPAFNTYVTQTPLTPDDDFLTLGGEPSSRALLRFDLPEPIEDSADIVRATLELVPQGALDGLPTDPPALAARAILADLGAKSPLSGDPQFTVVDTLELGSTDTVRVDVTRIVQLWQSSSERPEAIFLSLSPEGGSFSRPVFGSTRSGTVGPPRLRVTYLKTFPFESP